MQLDSTRPLAGFIGQDRAVIRLAEASNLCILGEMPDGSEPPLPHVLLLGSAGLGKGLRHDEPVVTPSGIRQIGELEPGDYVMGTDGLPTEVLDVFHRGELPLYRVTCNDGTEVLTDGDHLWTVRLRRLKDKWVTISTPEILEEVEQGSVFLPRPEPLKLDERDLPIDPWLLGALIGDGGLTQSSVRFSNGDLPIVRRVDSLLPAGVRTMHISRNDYRLAAPRHEENALRDALVDLGLMGCGSQDKFIPQSYLWASYDQRLELLRGILDTDGHAGTNQHIEWSTTSDQMVEDMNWLVSSLGGVLKPRRIHPHYTKDGVRHEASPAWRCSVRMPSGVNPFWLQRKAERVHRKGKYEPLRKIVKVEPIEAGKSVCIRVAASDSLFLTRNCVPTHNTTLAGMFAKDVELPLEVVTPPIKIKDIEAAVARHSGVCVLFIDEIHTLSRGDQDQLLVLMEERRMRLHGAWFEVPQLCVVGATTDPNMLTTALVERFGIVETLERYDTDTMVDIGRSMAADRGLTLGEEYLAELAGASGGVPRRMRRLIEESQRLVVSYGPDVDPRLTMERCGLSPTGLTANEVQYLRELRRAADVDPHQGVGAANLTAALGVSKDGLAEIESILLGADLIQRTRSGRRLTPAGRELETTLRGD